MDLVKKNIFSIACGVVALICVIAVFVWPVPGIWSSLQTEMAEHKSTFESIKRVRNDSRSLPQMDPDVTETPTLPLFPTASVVNVGAEAVQQRAEMAEAVLQDMVEINRREPLIPGTLPTYTSNQRLFDFRDAYLDRMAIVGSRVKDTSLSREVLQGAVPPLPEEIQAAGVRLRAQVEQREGIPDNKGSFVNATELTAKINAAIAQLPQQMLQDVIREAKLYIEPDAFSVHPEIVRAFDTRVFPDVANVFKAQVGLWIHEDVARTIAILNEDAPNVRTAKVKHLLRIDVPSDPFPSMPAGGGGFGGAAAGTEESALPVDNTATLTPDLSMPTGRSSNPFYDVVHFEVTLRCEASAVPEVIAAFGDHKLITVYQVDYIQPVDIAAEYARGFIYFGAEDAVPLLEMRLRCEALFLRSWLSTLMPAEVKQALAATAGSGMMQ